MLRNLELVPRDNFGDTASGQLRVAILLQAVGVGRGTEYDAPPNTPWEEIRRPDGEGVEALAVADTQPLLR